MGIKISMVTKKHKRSKPYYKSERHFVRIMKARGIKLIPYPQKFSVFVCGRAESYTPDFLEIGTNRYYEVTNHTNCYDRNEAKYKSFREVNPHLELINVSPNGEPYVHRARKPKYTYKEKSYYSKKHDEIFNL